MEDKLIDFETAKLAKIKGFNLDCIFAYGEDGIWDTAIDWTGELYFTKEDIDNAEQNNYKSFLAPSQSLLQRWLREVHNIHVFCEPDYNFGEETIGLKSYRAVITKGLFSNTKETEEFLPYEEALEAGLIVGLNLIKDKKDEDRN